MDNTKFILTTHGAYRLEERTVMTKDSLMSLLAKEQYINLGPETGTNRYHYLFYSSQEERHYIAVVDIKTKEIVTILYPDYRGAFEFDVELLEQAKEKALENSKVKRKNTPKKTRPEQQAAQPSYRLLLRYNVNGYPKYKNLGSYPSTMPIKKIVLTPEFSKHVIVKLKSKMESIPYDSILEFRQGKKESTAYLFPIMDLPIFKAK